MATNPNATGQQNYPAWDQAWQQHLQEIDNQIVEHYCNCSDKGPNQQQLTSQLHDWFGQQSLTPGAESDYAKVKQDPQYFNRQVQGRVDYLKQNGRLDRPQAMQASAGAADGYGASGQRGDGGKPASPAGTLSSKSYENTGSDLKTRQPPTAKDDQPGTTGSGRASSKMGGYPGRQRSPNSDKSATSGADSRRAGEDEGDSEQSKNQPMPPGAKATGQPGGKPTQG
jgi:hypothetical protein